MLKPGGRFITQQVGEQNNAELNEWLGGRSEDFGVTRGRSESQLIRAGLKIVELSRGLFAREVLRHRSYRFLSQSGFVAG